MDWSRAKSILIFILIALNIFLAVNLFYHNTSDSVSKKTVSDTINILKSRNVSIQCDVPRTSSDPGELYYEDYKLNITGIANMLLGSVITGADGIKPGQELSKGSRVLKFSDENSFVYKDSSPNTAIDISNKNDVERYAGKFLAEIGLQDVGTVLDGYKTVNNSVELIFRQKYGRYTVFDNYARFVLDQKGITYFECRYKKPKDIITKNKKIVSASQLLLKNYYNSEGVSISGIGLILMEYSIEQGSKEFCSRPVWRIESADTIDFYSAYDGIKVKSLPKTTT